MLRNKTLWYVSLEKFTLEKWEHHTSNNGLYHLTFQGIIMDYR